MREQVIDHIKREDVNRWTVGDIITINAQTGSGKTHFVLNVLYHKAKEAGKKILLFLPRRHTLNQLQTILDKEQKGDIILLKLYQEQENTLNTLERGESLSDNKKKNRINGKNLLYIVADESHYFFDDAVFNGSTDVSFLKIMNYCEKVITVFMSATSKILDNYLTDVLKKKVTSYTVPHDYSHIRKLYFFNDDSVLENLLGEWYMLNIKALIFIQSPGNGIRVKREYPNDTIFACSKSNPSSAVYHKEAVDDDEIENVLKNERFETQFLVATSCFDVGINIKDPQLHNIVIDMKDEHSLIQCLGRKRIINEKDYVDVYIKLHTSKSLNYIIRKSREMIEPAEYLMSHSQLEFVTKYKKIPYDNMLIFDEPDADNETYSKQVNQMMYHKKIAQIDTSLTMLNEYKCRGVFPQDNYGYAKYIATLWEKYDEDNEIYQYEVLDKGEHDSEQRIKQLEDYLQKKLGMVYPNLPDRKPLIQTVGLRAKRSNGTYDNKLLVQSADSINGFLKKMQLPYQIEVKEIPASADGKTKHLRAAWIIVKA